MYIENTMKYKGYIGSVEYSSEDDCLYGQVLGIRDLLLYEGMSVKKLRKDFEECIECYLESCEYHKEKPQVSFDGNLPIRISPDTHLKLAKYAKAEELSVEELVARIVEEYVDKRMAA